MIRLSIIVPAVGTRQEIDDTLISILENRPENCEIIMPCHQSYVDPYALDDELTMIRQPTFNTTELLNAGLLSAKGTVVHWITPGITVAHDWTNSVLDRFDDPDVAAVSPIIVNQQNPVQIISAGVMYTAGGNRIAIGAGKRLDPNKPLRRRPLGPSLLAGFCDRKTIVSCGGFDCSLGTDFADAQFGLQLVQTDLTCYLDDYCIVTANPRRRNLGLRYGWHSTRMFRGARRVHKKRHTLMHRGCHLIAEAICNFFRPSWLLTVVGRLCGNVESIWRQPSSFATPDLQKPRPDRSAKMDDVDRGYRRAA